MRYIVSVIDDQTGSADPTEIVAIDAFNQRLRDQGHWIFAGGLASPDTATVIDNRGGKGLVTVGPFMTSHEYVSGFWIIEAPDVDVAVGLATEGSMACNRRVEVRAFLG